MKVTRLIYFACIVSSVCLAGVEDLGMGHLRANSPSPAHILRPGISAVTMPRVPLGSWEATYSVTWANVWNIDTHDTSAYIIDGEWMTAQCRVVYSPAKNVEMGLTVPYSLRFGGFTDEIVESWHDFFGMGNEDRQYFERDEVLIDIREGNERVFLIRGENQGLNDLPFYVSCLLNEESAVLPAIALQLSVSIPLGDEEELEGLGESIYGIGIMASHHLFQSKHILQVGGRFSYTAQDYAMGMEIRKENYAGLLCYEHRWSDNLSIIAQYLYSSPLAVDYYQFSEPSHELVVGFKCRNAERTSLEFAVTEDIFNFSNNTDFGLHLGFSHRL